LYIDVPKKINNSDFKNIPNIPIEVSIREKIGKIILPSEIESIPNQIENLKMDLHKIKEEIKKIRENTIFNIGNSEKKIAESIIEILNESKK